MQRDLARHSIRENIISGIKNLIEDYKSKFSKTPKIIFLDEKIKSLANWQSEKLDTILGIRMEYIKDLPEPILQDADDFFRIEKPAQGNKTFNEWEFYSFMSGFHLEIKYQIRSNKNIFLENKVLNLVGALFPYFSSNKIKHGDRYNVHFFLNNIDYAYFFLEKGYGDKLPKNIRAKKINNSYLMLIDDDSLVQKDIEFFIYKFGEACFKDRGKDCFPQIWKGLETDFYYENL